MDLIIPECQGHDSHPTKGLAEDLSFAKDIKVANVTSLRFMDR